MSKVTITVCGIKVKEYETVHQWEPDIEGFLKAMRELEPEVKTQGSKVKVKDK